MLERSADRRPRAGRAPSRSSASWDSSRLVETGTHVVFAAALAPYATSELALAPAVLAALRPDMLCLADRFFPSFDLWQHATTTGAALLWRIRKNARLPVLERLADGSYRSELRPTWHSRATDRRPIPVRVIEYTLPKVRGAAPLYRLVTTLLDETTAPAEVTCPPMLRHAL